MAERTTSWQRSFGSVRAFMTQAVDGGSSFNAFYRATRAAKISYSRSRMLSDWRGVQGIYKYEAGIKNLLPTSLIPDNFTTLGRKGQRQNFLAGVEYTYIDESTGEEIKGIRMIGSDARLSKEELEDMASGAFEEGRPYADPSARGFKLRFVTAKPS